MLNPDPKRRAVQLIRLTVALAIAAVAIFAIIPDGSASIEMSDGWEVSADGLYLQYDGTAVVTNTYNSPLDGADVEISFSDPKTGKSVPIWSGTVDVPAHSSVEVPINVKVSSLALSAAVIDSLKTEDSPLRAHVELDSAAMYGLVDVSLSFDTGIDLADEGTALEYEVVRNDDTEFRVALRNLADCLVPGDDSITMTSGTDVLTVEYGSVGDELVLSAHGNGDLGNLLDVMDQSIDSVETGSGTYVDTETAKQIAAMVDYARWLL